MKFILLDRSEFERNALELMLAHCLEPSQSHELMIYGYEPRDVFDSPLEKNVCAAFITISSMADVEATRQYAKVYAEIPLFVVSDSEEYSIECYRFNARYYLKRPISKEELKEALRRC